MTWQSAKSVAHDYVVKLLAHAKSMGHPLPAAIRLTDYEDEASYLLLKGPHEWPLEFHRMVTKAIARELKRSGFSVEIKTVKLESYWSWLEATKQENTPATRAQFIAL